jgi:TIR domain
MCRASGPFCTCCLARHTAGVRLIQTLGRKGDQLFSAPKNPVAFFSYSRLDYPFARRLALALGPEIQTRLDLNFLRPGDNWQNEINKELLNCLFVVVLVSPAAMKSREVAREVDAAKALGKRIVPVVIEDVDSLEAFEELHLVDGRRSYRTAALALSNLIAGRNSDFGAPARYRSRLATRWIFSNSTTINIPVFAYLAYGAASLTIPLNLLTLSILVYRGDFIALGVVIIIAIKLSFLHLFATRKLNLFATMVVFGIVGILPTIVLADRAWSITSTGWREFLLGTLFLEITCLLVAVCPPTVRAWLPQFVIQPRNVGQLYDWLFRYRTTD